MELKNIDLQFENFSRGGRAILKNVAPDYPYRDGQRILTEVIGRRVTVVFPNNGYDTLTVKVADPVDALTPLLNKATADRPVYVEFDGFTAAPYSMRGDDGRWRTGISAKADAVRVVDASQIIDFGTEID